MTGPVEGGTTFGIGFFLTILAVVLIAGAHLLIFSGFTIDDAYITFSYAKNLAQGHGLTFSNGIHVEATSSMLWAVLLSPFEYFAAGAVIGAKVLGFAFAAACLVLSAHLTRQFLGETQGRTTPISMLLVCYLLAINSAFILWAIYGMENGLMALLLLVSVALFVREFRAGHGFVSAIPMWLLETSRPEGFLFVLVFAIFRLASVSGRRYPRHSDNMWWFAILGVLIISYEAWGYWFYGHLFPLSALAKVDSTISERLIRGTRYLIGDGRLALACYFIALVFLGLHFLQAQFGKKDPRYYPLILVNSLIGTQIVFVFAAGGDWMVHGRFLSHIWPLVIISMVVSGASCYQDLSSIRIPLYKVLFTLFITAYTFVCLHAVYKSYRWAGYLQVAEERALCGMAAYLNSIADDNDTVACSDVGRMAYYFRGKVRDWWGLADPELYERGEAMGKIRADTVLGWKPRFIVLYSNAPWLSKGTVTWGMATLSTSFVNSSEFVSTYCPRASLLFSEGRYHVLFERCK